MVDLVFHEEIFSHYDLSDIEFKIRVVQCVIVLYEVEHRLRHGFNAVHQQLIFLVEFALFDPCSMRLISILLEFVGVASSKKENVFGDGIALYPPIKENFFEKTRNILVRVDFVKEEHYSRVFFTLDCSLCLFNSREYFFLRDAGMHIESDKVIVHYARQQLYHSCFTYSCLAHCDRRSFG